MKQILHNSEYCLVKQIAAAFFLCLAGCHHAPGHLESVSRPDGFYAVNFIYHPEGEAHEVKISGSFNHWNPVGIPMEKDPDGFFWETLILPAGTHQYKFIVDGKRIADPANPMHQTENDKDSNSVVIVGAMRPEDRRHLRGDGRIDERLVLFLATPEYAQAYDDRLRLTVRTARGDVENVGVRCIEKQGEKHFLLERVRSDFLYDYYQGDFLHGHSSFEGDFVLQDGRTHRVLGPKGVSRKRGRGWRPYQFDLRLLKVFDVPDWSRRAVIYQILPERFRNGDPSNDPDGPIIPWTADWDTLRSWEKPPLPDAQSRRAYGGDLRGVMEKLDYLQQLGVTAICFNPLFEAESTHKYDTTSFLHVDDNFGVKGDVWEALSREDPLDPRTWEWTPSDKLFLQLIQQAHKHGIKIIIDGVFNHVGTKFWAFQDAVEKGPESSYLNWFTITSLSPLTYESWGGDKNTVVLQQGPEGFDLRLRFYLAAVTHRWMDPDGDGDPSDGVDGWRLDAATEVSPYYWRDWRDLVKHINPDAYIVGESWENAADQLMGDQFDAVTNYPFAVESAKFFLDVRGAVSASDYLRSLQDLISRYPPPVDQALMNCLDSHDTDRIASQAFNPDRSSDRFAREQDAEDSRYKAGRPSPEAYEAARLLAAMQFAYPGSPTIYYGDELGMWGASDPDCRKPMLWRDLEPYENSGKNHMDEELFRYYQRLAALRNSFSVLQEGTFEPYLAEDTNRSFVFVRRLQGESARRAPGQPHVLYVAVNADQRPHRLAIPLLNPEVRAYVDVLNSRSLAVVTHSEDSNSSPTQPRLAWKSAPERVGIYYQDQIFVDVPARSAVYLIPFSDDTSSSPVRREFSAEEREKK